MIKKTQSRLLSLVLAICMLLGSLPAVNVAAADELTEQDGYYLIYTADDLFAFNAIVNTSSGTNNKNAKLMANIDLKNEPWTPLGRFSDYGISKGSYNATFDGNGYVISNLYVEITEQYETGFFGRLQGTVKNLGIVNATIINTAGIRAGIIAGDIVGGRAENVFTDGTVTTSHAQAGGLSGEIANGATYSNCYTTNSTPVVSVVGSNTLSNVFYVANEDTDAYDWTSVITDKAMFETGEAAYVMNEKIGSTVWYQNLDNDSDVDAWPVGVNTHGTVYKVKKTLCAGVQDQVDAYSNTNQDIVSPSHPFENGMCPHCGAVVSDADLAYLREEAVNDLKKYVDLADYREAQQAEINEIISETEAELESCDEVEGIANAVKAAKASIDEIKTDAEISREELKPTADAKIQALNDSVDLSLYRTAQVAEINEIIADVSEDIYEATTEVRINSLVNSATSEIAAIPTDADFEAGVASIEEGISDAFMSLYYEAQQTEIRTAVANGIAAVNAATTKDGITSAVNSANNAINSIKTAEQVDFLNTYSDSSNGLLAYDGFVGNVGKIQGQNTGVGFMNGFDFEGASYNNLQISIEQPMRYGNLLSSPKYLTYKNGDYRSGRSFAPWGDSSFDKAGVASDGLIGKNGSGLPVYMSFLMRTNGGGNNAIEFHQTNGFWHGGSRRFAVGSFNAEDGIESSSVNGKNYWSLRIGPDGGDVNKIVRSNKEFDANETVLVVLKMEFNYPSESKISMYLNPDLSKELPAEADAVATTLKDIRFRGMTNHANSKFDFDELRVGTSYEAVTPLATYKFPVTKVKLTGDIENLKGSTIMGSNESPTSGFETIAKIPEDITSGTVEITDITNTNAYRYVKYYGKAGTYGKLSEMELYSGIRKLEGTPFGTVADTGYDATKAFDGDADTYYIGQVADDQYVGLDLGGETSVAEPTTDIEPGRYENALSINLLCETEGAEIYYTTDGTTPTKLNGKKFDGTPIEVAMGSSVLIKAIAYKQGLFDSDMMVAGFGAGADAPVAEGLNVFMMGNSLTDTVVNGTLSTVAQSAGFDHKTGKLSIPGAAIVWHYTHKDGAFGTWVTDPGELSTEQTEEFSEIYNEQYYFNPDNAKYAIDGSEPYDIMTVQPFNNGDYYNSKEDNNVISVCQYYYDLAEKYNPGIRFLLYSSWGALKNEVDAWEFEGSNSSYVKMNENISKDMAELYPDAPEFNIIPNTQALEELKRQILAGEFPGGVTDFVEFAAADAVTDSLHLSERGQYLIACTTFVTMYKTSPVGLITYKPDSLTDEQALALQNIAYDVNIKYPYSGVSVTGTTPRPTATAKPSATATAKPSATATAKPSATATAKPSATATAKPSATATAKPSATATATPTTTPTAEPTKTPEGTPSTDATTAPTTVPTADVTVAPTIDATPVVDALAKAKADAKAALDSYVNLDNYREAEKAALTTIIAEAKAAVDTLTTVEEVNVFVELIKAAMNEVPTDAELTAMENSMKKVKKVKFVKKKIKVKVGKKATLKVKLTPKKLTKAAKKVKWSINKKGKKVVKFVKKAKKLKGKLKVKIKAVKKGKAKITCKAPSGKKAVCKIIVK